MVFIFTCSIRRPNRAVSMMPHLTLIDNTDNKTEAIQWADTGSLQSEVVQIGFL